MKPRHLSDRELFEISRGTLEDASALEHVASCTRCREAVVDSSTVNLLDPASGPRRASGPHLTAEQLEYYRCAALPAVRMKEIERHLQSCSRCLALFMRDQPAESAANFTGPGLIRKLGRALSPDREKWLGTVLVTGLDAGPRAVLLAGGRVDFGPRLFVERPPPSPAGRHPGSAGQRTTRVRRSLDELSANEQRASPAAFIVSRESVVLDDTGPSTVVEPIWASTEKWAVSIRADAEHAGLHLGVRLVPTAAKLSPAGLRVKLHGPDGQELNATTDASGGARLAIPSGRSRIRIETVPPLTFSLTVLA